MKALARLRVSRERYLIKKKYRRRQRHAGHRTHVQQKTGRTRPSFNAKRRQDASPIFTRATCWFRATLLESPRILLLICQLWFWRALKYDAPMFKIAARTCRLIREYACI